MAFWLVTAEPIEDRLTELARKLRDGEIRPLRPFGPTLDASLRGARIREDGVALWEEEDYCDPPLAEERRAVLDEHFTGIEVEAVREGEGWSRIEDLPRLLADLEITPPGR